MAVGCLWPSAYLTLLTDEETYLEAGRGAEGKLGHVSITADDSTESSLAHIHKGPRMVTNHGHRRCTVRVAWCRRQPRTNCWCALIFPPVGRSTTNEGSGRRETRAFADEKKKHDSLLGRSHTLRPRRRRRSAAPQGGERPRRGKKIRYQIAGGPSCYSLYDINAPSGDVCARPSFGLPPPGKNLLEGVANMDTHRHTRTGDFSVCGHSGRSLPFGKVKAECRSLGVALWVPPARVGRGDSFHSCPVRLLPERGDISQPPLHKYCLAVFPPYFFSARPTRRSFAPRAAPRFFPLFFAGSALIGYMMGSRPAP